MHSILLAIFILASGAVPGAGADASSAPPLIQQGEEHLKQEKFQQALNDFSEILKTEPNHIAANLGRARALLGLGDGPKAAGPARLVCEQEPENVAAWMVLGDAYSHESAQDYPRAAEAYRKVLDLDPKNRRAGLRLARALSYQKEVDQAIGVLEGILKHHPEDVLVLVKLGESYYAIRKLDRAEELLKRAQSLAPDNPEVQRVADQVSSRRAYNFWVPIIAIIVFPLIYFLVRFMRKGRVPKVPES
jgi:cytochrome c-type biogenesis protein CcmH/NrfG